MDSKKIRVIIVMAIILLIAYYILCFFKNYMLVREGEQYLSLYEKVVGELLTSKDNQDMLKSADDYIAFDATSFNIGSEQDKHILEMELRKYHNNPIFANYEMLKEDTFMNEDGSLKGVYISASELKYGKVSVSFVINMTDYTGTTHGFNIKAVYKNNGWNIKKMEPFTSFDLYVKED